MATALGRSSHGASGARSTSERILTPSDSHFISLLGTFADHHACLRERPEHVEPEHVDVQAFVPNAAVERLDERVGPRLPPSRQRLGLEHDLPEGLALLDEAVCLGRLGKGQLAVHNRAAELTLRHELDQVI